MTEKEAILYHIGVARSYLSAVEAGLTLGHGDHQENGYELRASRIVSWLSHDIYMNLYGFKNKIRLDIDKLDIDEDAWPAKT